MINLKNHQKIALGFSGGKDSIACLILLKDHLDKITVFWLNTGDAFPETIAQVEQVRNMCPNFIEVKSNQPDDIAVNGYPVDLLPIRNHIGVQAAFMLQRLPLQSFIACCEKNRMHPLQKAMIDFGATMIIRGQKLSDHHKSPVMSGDVIGGIEYFFPLQNMTDKDVMDLVSDSALLPEHYEYANTSLDCMHCTAYLSENTWKLGYLERNHPIQGKEVRKRFIQIRQEINREYQFLASVENA
jgi:phosphoadenosine phosphosulfate reductase